MQERAARDLHSKLQMPRVCGRKVVPTLLMCRRIVIDCEWDDDSPKDAADLFDHTTNFDTLNPWFSHILGELLHNRFNGQITISVERLHG